MLSVYILLDRSGSMASRWQPSIDSINEYVNVLRDSGVDGKINFIAFDSNTNNYIRSMTWGGISSSIAPIESTSTLEVVRKDVEITEWASLTGSEVGPRGGTPLFDAVIETKNIIESDVSDKGIFLIITDGGENASTNYKEVAEGAVTYVKNRGWEVVFLGANFDNSKDAKGMGVSREYYASYQDVNVVQTMNYMGTRSAAYATTGLSMAMSDDDRKKNKLA